MSEHGSSGMGMPKHRKSGKAGINRRRKQGKALAQEREEADQPTNPTTEQHDSVGGLFEVERKRKGK